MAVASCSTSILPFRPSLAVTLMPQVHHSELFQYSVARFLRNLTTNRRLSAPACRKASTTTSYSSRRNNLSPVIVARIQSGKVAHKSVRYHHKSFSPTQQLPGNEDDGQSDYRRPASKASDRKQSLKHLNDDELRGNTVFLRCDFNVRLDESRKIVDDTRIRSSLPSIKHLIHAGSRVVLASHLGRPRTSRDEMYSLKPIAERLSEMLQQRVGLAPDCVGPEVDAQIASMKNGEVLLLENVRFHAEEEANDIEFSKQLAKNIDFFVNDAFGISHRAHASTAGIANYVSRRVAGLLMEKELEYLSSVIQRPEHPLIAIVGGSEISSKLPVMEALMKTSDKLIIGGQIVFTFLKSQGYNVGASAVEDDQLDAAKRLTELAEENGVELVLPSDILCADKLAKDANTQICQASSIPNGWMGLDIGPKSIRHFTQFLKEAKVVVWNGPMGVFEVPPFDEGSVAIAKAVAEAPLLRSIVCGGDTVEMVEKAGYATPGGITHISTGGGAALELLAGMVVPGVAALDDVRIHA